MPRSSRSHLPYVVFVAALWAVALPGILVADAGNGLVWRGPLQVGVAAALAAAGLASVTAGARALVAAGVRPFGVRPGPRLVTDGPYGIVRNPIDIGTTLIAVASWVALDLDLIWVVPVAALASFVAASGPYEDRLLVEGFGDDFTAYRRAVRKWLPRR